MLTKRIECHETHLTSANASAGGRLSHQVGPVGVKPLTRWGVKEVVSHGASAKTQRDEFKEAVDGPPVGTMGSFSRPAGVRWAHGSMGGFWGVFEFPLRLTVRQVKRPCYGRVSVIEEINWWRLCRNSQTYNFSVYLVYRVL